MWFHDFMRWNKWFMILIELSQRDENVTFSFPQNYGVFHHVWNSGILSLDKKGGCLGYIWDYTPQLCGIFANNYKDIYWPKSIIESKAMFFCLSRWWFQIFVLFTPILGESDPSWLEFFKWVGSTTNKMSVFQPSIFQVYVSFRQFYVNP